MKKIKAKMNNDQKVQFVLSCCDGVYLDRLAVENIHGCTSEETYLTFREELEGTLRSTQRITWSQFGGLKGSGVNKRGISGYGQHLALQRTNIKLTKATIRQLKCFSKYTMVAFFKEHDNFKKHDKHNIF